MLGQISDTTFLEPYLVAELGVGTLNSLQDKFLGGLIKRNSWEMTSLRFESKGRGNSKQTGSWQSLMGRHGNAHGLTPRRTACPLVSVIVATRNSADTLEICLASIRKQTYDRLEIIVVDNFSTDATREIATKYADSVVLGGPERTSQVNLGFTHSHGGFVYWVGSDFVLESGVVEEAVRAALEEDAVAVIIPNLSDPRRSFWARVRSLERLTYVGSGQIEAARFFRRDAYEKSGGYNPAMIAYEEHDLHNRISRYGRIARIRNSSEWHVGEPVSLSEIVIKHWYYGKSIGEYVKGYPSKAAIQLLPIRRSFLKEGRLFARQPSLLAGFIIYQVVRYLSAAFGFLAR